MKLHGKTLLVLSLLASCGLMAGNGPRSGRPNRPTRPVGPPPSVGLKPSFGKLPLAFEPNVGQTDREVQFLAHGSGYSLFVTSQEAVLVLKAPIEPLSGHSRGRLSRAAFPERQDPAKPTVLRMRLSGSARTGTFESLEPLPGIANYFIGNDPSRWHRHIPTYARIRSASVYPGIDLVYYGNQGKLEYDFVVKPGGDPSAVRLRYEGARSSRVNTQGDLELDTDRGTLRFQAPRLYQESWGQRRPVEGRYRLIPGGELGFEVRDYDHSRPLVIDPTLDYSTYWGGSGLDLTSGVAVDAAGNAYIAGGTQSTNFPTVNPIFPARTAFQNGFVAEINAAGTAMLYSTFLGGNSYDQVNGIAVDAAGNAFVTGYTSSGTFPTVNPIQAANGGSFDFFVTEVAAGGTSLIYSTYLGGTGQDGGFAIALDGSDNAYVGGQAASAAFPTVNPIQATLNGPANAVVLEVNPVGSALVYSTYLGGNGFDQVVGITADNSGAAVATGYTQSSDFPVVNPLAGQGTQMGPQNAFLTMVAAGGTSWVYSSYLGGNCPGGEQGSAVKLDALGNVFVAGFTTSTNFPTLNAYQGSLAGPQNAFLCEVAINSGSGLPEFLYSSYLGGAVTEYAYGLALDAWGDAYITGFTNSPNYPVVDPLPGMGAMTNPNGNVFITEIRPDGNPPVFSTFLGGNAFEYGTGIATDGSGGTYVTGLTYSSDFPVTVTPPQGGLSGSSDAFILKIDQPTPTFTPTPTPTDTATSTPTNSATDTATPTNTSTPTNTPTNSATATPTNTATNTATSTPTSTASFTATSTPSSTTTSTPTSTPTLTPTASTTSTPTASATVTPTDTPAILTVTIGDPYPNPYTGGGSQVQIPLIVPTGSSADWEVYTTAFRRVVQRGQSLSGNYPTLAWDLRDTWGTPVSNGLYYMRVHVRGLKSGTRILKLLVIR